MSRLLENCRKSLEEEIKVAEASLVKAAHHLASSTEVATHTLEAGLKETLVKCEAKREQAEHAGQRIKLFLEEKATHAISQFEDWKTDREIGKLEKNADKREQQAVDAIIVASYALMEAEVAIMEALKARKVAIEVAG
jgi:23S rRNA-/tRNA-specific pseudouridylate synthase